MRKSKNIKTAKPAKNKKGIDTYCPLFPGFYGTRFEDQDNERQELEHLFEQLGITGRASETLADCAAKSGRLYTVNYAAFYLAYSQNITVAISDLISEECPALKGFSGFEFQELRSPKEYNFYNDSINIKVLYKNKKTFLLSLLGMIQENRQEFDKHISEHYTSRRGFISHYSNDPADWINDIFQALKPARTKQKNCYVKETKQGPSVLEWHKLGRLLDFICEVQGITESDILERAEVPALSEYMAGPLVELCNGKNPALPEKAQEILNTINKGQAQYKMYCDLRQTAGKQVSRAQTAGFQANEAALYKEAAELLINGEE
jgi:hypothetical protein